MTQPIIDSLRRLLPNLIHRKAVQGIHLLAYHAVVEHISDPLLERNFHLLSDFETQVNLLTKYQILSLTELIEGLQSSKWSSRGRPTAVITFDDGYLNSLLAAEVLSLRGMPWVLFIPSAAIGRDKFIWTSELSLLLLHGQNEEIELLAKTWSLRSRKDRENAFQSIRLVLKKMPSRLRKKSLELLRSQFPADEIFRLLQTFPSLKMLNWEEIKQLHLDGVDIGSHGVDHELHHAQQEQSTRLYELVESKREIEIRLGAPCRSFSYPNGDFIATSPDEVCSAGYEVAFTMQSGIIDRRIRPFLLPRIDPGELFQS